MIEVAPAALSVPLSLSVSWLTTTFPDYLVWVVIAAFIATAALEGYDRDLARGVGMGAWVLFGLFWGVLFPRFAFEMRSFIEGTLCLVAVPLCVYTGYQLYTGRDSLFVLSRGVAAMGLIYVPFLTIEPLRQSIVELVSAQTNAVIHLLGYDPDFTIAEQNGYHSAFIFHDSNGHRYYTYLVLACTGIGSMSIFGGLIAAVRAPLRRKISAFVMAISIIWVLNVIRNVFISVAFGNQWFQIFIGPVTSLTGYTDPKMVSFFIADRVFSQLLAVISLVIILWLVVRILPELLTVIEDVIYLVSGREYDLSQRTRADGGR
ncbi:MAG: archaeosortase A [Haladaptatus sp.]